MIRCIFADRSQDIPSEKFTSSAYNIPSGSPSHPSKIGIFCRGPFGPPGLSLSSSQKKVFSCRGPSGPGPPLPSYQKGLFCSGPPGPPLATLSKNGLFVEGDPSGPQAFPSHPSKIGIFCRGPPDPLSYLSKNRSVFCSGPRAPPSYSPRKRHFLVGSS